MIEPASSLPGRGPGMRCGLEGGSSTDMRRDSTKCTAGDFALRRRHSARSSRYRTARASPQYLQATPRGAATKPQCPPYRCLSIVSRALFLLSTASSTAAVVIVRRREAVKRCDDRAVEFAKRSCTADSVEIEHQRRLRELRGSGEGLRLECAMKGPRIEKPERRLELLRPGGEVERHAHDGCSSDPRCITAFPQELENLVSSQRRAEQQKPVSRKSVPEMIEQEREIAGLSRVVEARSPIRDHHLMPFRVAGTRAEIHGDGGKACIANQREHSLHVDRVGAPLEPVKKDKPEASRRRVEMIDDEIVVVRSRQYLASQRNQRALARDPSPDRLKVR
jgi:hypothetical protein